MNLSDTPAFPTQETDRAQGWPGMSLRQYAAIHADIPWSVVLEGLHLKFAGLRTDFTISEVVSYRAQLKVCEADALLAELEKGEK